MRTRAKRLEAPATVKGKTPISNFDMKKFDDPSEAVNNKEETFRMSKQQTSLGGDSKKDPGYFTFFPPTGDQKDKKSNDNSHNSSRRKVQKEMTPPVHMTSLDEGIQPSISL